MDATNAAHTAATAAAGGSPRPVRILVWDLPVRVFHWLTVLSFAGAWLSAESERWRLVHVTLGTTLAGLLAFRLVWGLVGSRHARFSDFVTGPGAVLRYGRALLRGRPEHHVGHNPAGALAIVGLLALGALTTGTGLALDRALLDPRWDGLLGEAHEFGAEALLVLVGIHVAGVALASWLHRENLVAALFSGRKTGPPAQAIASAWRSLGALLLVAVLGFWWWEWRSAPVSPGPSAEQVGSAPAGAQAAQAGPQVGAAHGGG